MRKATDIYFDLNDGHKIPALGLGTVPSGDPKGVADQVYAAVKAGYRLIDTAWYYGTERYVGQALKKLFDDGVVKREEIYITTKVWPSYYHNPEKSLDESLEQLGLDYVDLLLQHWPIALNSDENGLPAVPKNEDGSLKYDDDPKNGTKWIDVYQELVKIKQNTKKVRSVGVSNYSLPRLRKLLENVDVIPVVNQIEYHPQLPQDTLVQFAKKHGIVIEAYSPVGGPGAPVVKLPLVEKLAHKYQVTTNEIANAYHILQGRVPLPRSSNLERIKTNVRLPDLDPKELELLYQVGLANPKRYCVDPWGYGLGFKWWEGDEWSDEFE